MAITIRRRSPACCGACVGTILVTACSVMLGSGTAANAGSDPLQDVHDSTPIGGFATPGGYGQATGADGSVDSTVWGLTTNDGWFIQYDGFNTTPLSFHDLGYQLTGVAKIPDGCAFSDGSTIYKFDNNLQPTGLIDVLGTPHVTDVDYALGHFFVSTQDGVYRVLDEQGHTQQTATGGWNSCDINECDGYYSNPLGQFEGNTFSNVDFEGIPFGSPAFVDFHNNYQIKGVAYFDGGMAVVQAPGVELHNEMLYQQHMIPVAVNPLRGFAECMEGPDVSVSAECEHYDYGPDGDVDLADFAFFQASF
jgi:hypothetical protein